MEYYPANGPNVLNTKEMPASAAVRAQSPIPPAVISSTVWCSSPAKLVANGGKLVPSLPDATTAERSACSDASQRP
jgi:hypothetical protein